jgi:hypothetical protein
MYLATAWVISVMLPPMAIFFPLFTLLEDFGYLPRVAFNLDNLYKKAGAHGKQSLSMMMGFGCNAAGVVATRVIDSPRERLIAIITNNFALCNGRWPTQILIATLFIGALVSAQWAGLISALAVVGIAVLGVVLSFLVSYGLSRSVLKGEVSTFSLELPPYRPPRVLQTIYTSIIDRTLIILGRAVMFALPAGAVIWLISNIQIGGVSIAQHLVSGLDPIGLLIGLNGVILVAYIVAIPANEIVIPTILMLTVLTTGAAGPGGRPGVMFETDNAADLMALFTAGGWTLLTAVNLMLFSLIHNPCSTTIFTIFKETGSRKWTAVAALRHLPAHTGGAAGAVPVISGRPRRHPFPPPTRAPLRMTSFAAGKIPYLPERIQQLEALALNLAWRWNRQARALLRMVDPILWSLTRHNPVEMLQRVDPATLARCAVDPAFLELYDHTIARLDDQLSTPDTWWAERFPELGAERPVAYFCAEFGLHNSIPIYSGGLGVLAGDHCKAASDLGVPLVGSGSSTHGDTSTRRSTSTAGRKTPTRSSTPPSCPSCGSPARAAAPRWHGCPAGAVRSIWAFGD